MTIQYETTPGTICATFDDGLRICWRGSPEIVDDPPMRPILDEVATEMRRKLEASMTTVHVPYFDALPPDVLAAALAAYAEKEGVVILNGDHNRPVGRLVPGSVAADDTGVRVQLALEGSVEYLTGTGAVMALSLQPPAARRAGT